MRAIISTIVLALLCHAEVEVTQESPEVKAILEKISAIEAELEEYKCYDLWEKQDEENLTEKEQEIIELCENLNEEVVGHDDALEELGYEGKEMLDFEEDDEAVEEVKQV